MLQARCHQRKAFNMQRNRSNHTRNAALSEPTLTNIWYKSPLGQYLLDEIKQRLDPVLATSFGYYALSVGGENLASEIFKSSRVKYIFCLGQGGQGQDVEVINSALPIANDSTDLVVLIHTLSQSKDPYAILRETNRVLIPDGKLIIIDFNPISLWGLRHFFQAWLDEPPWAGHYYTARRMKDWTRVLGFEQLHHFRCGYVFPLNYSGLIQRSRIFSKFSERWLRFSAALNLLVLEKNTIPLTPVRRRWVKRQILPPTVAGPTVGRGMKYDN